MLSCVSYDVSTIAHTAAVVVRIMINYLAILATLGGFRAKGTETFRALFGWTQSVGDSPLSLAPFQCVLGTSFYAKSAASLSMPIAIALLSVVVNLVVIAVRRGGDDSLARGSAVVVHEAGQ